MAPVEPRCRVWRLKDWIRPKGRAYGRVLVPPAEIASLVETLCRKPKMKPSLKGMSRKDLEKLKADIDKALARVEIEEKKAARLAAEKAAKALGYSLDELRDVTLAKKPRTTKVKDGRAKVAPKYRNPNDAEQTWTGRGRKPKWVEAHLASGGTLEQVEIKQT